MHTHATALFPDRHSAHVAVEQLVQAGFPRDAIGVVMSENAHEREFGAASPDRSGVRIARSAGVLGAIVAGLVPVATPGGETLRVGGPPVAALTRTGDLSAALVALGLNDAEARAASAGVGEGAMVVGVQAAAERLPLAMQLLELSGGAPLEAESNRPLTERRAAGAVVLGNSRERIASE
jgi:hypothetical protein